MKWHMSVINLMAYDLGRKWVVGSGLDINSGQVKDGGFSSRLVPL